MANTGNDRKLTEFLLRRLPEDEQEDLERDFFENDTLAAEMLAAEESLMADYSAGVMDPETKRQFENSFHATAAQRREHDLVKSLGSLSLPKDAPEERRSVFYTVALAACIAMLAIGAAVLLYQNRQLREEIRSVQSSIPTKPVPRPAPEHSTVSGNNAAAAPVSAEVPTILLVAGVRESAVEGQVIQVPPSASVLILQADIASGRPSEYWIRLETVDGELLYQAGALPGGTQRGSDRVQAPLPASVAPPGDYILVVLRRDVPRDSHPATDFQKAGEFYFRVIGK